MTINLTLTLNLRTTHRSNHNTNPSSEALDMVCREKIVQQYCRRICPLMKKYLLNRVVSIFPAYNLKLTKPPWQLGLFIHVHVLKQKKKNNNKQTKKHFWVHVLPLFCFCFCFFFSLTMFSYQGCDETVSCESLDCLHLPSSPECPIQHYKMQICQAVR
jgi:hypothetical protein